MKAQILEGKLASYFGEKILLDQKFIKNPEMTIQGMLDKAVQKFGEKTESRRGGANEENRNKTERNDQEERRRYSETCTAE